MLLNSFYSNSYDDVLLYSPIIVILLTFVILSYSYLDSLIQPHETSSSQYCLVNLNKLCETNYNFVNSGVSNDNIREFQKTTTAMTTSLNKRFSEQYHGCQRP